MRAIILAAGRGQRLMPYTRDIPKCMVELADRPLLMHQIEALNSAGIDDIHVVTGYRGDRVADLGFCTLPNPLFAETGMVASLMCAAHLMDGTDDVLIACSDILYEPQLIHELQACDSPISTVVDRQWRRQREARFDDPLADAETLRLDDDGCIVDIGGCPEHDDEIQGQYVGLTQVSASHAHGLVGFHHSIAEVGMDVARMDMIGFLQVLMAAGWTVQAAPVDGGWLKVGDVSDLELYRALHEQDQLDTYWRAEVGAAVCEL